MSVFVIADTHLSLSTESKSMEVFGGCWNGYINKLEKNWNEDVKDSDSVIIAGDISWGTDIDLCIEDFRFLNDELNGIKYILKGNHDYWWNTATKMTAKFERNGFDKLNIVHNNAYLCENYIICGTRGWFIDTDAENGENSEESEKPEEEAFNQKILKREVNRLELSVQAAKKIRSESCGCEIVACIHYPPIYGDYICSEIINVLEREEIRRCYFGHIHNANEAKVKKEYKNINFELVSADYLKFKPFKL